VGDQIASDKIRFPDQGLKKSKRMMLFIATPDQVQEPRRERDTFIEFLTATVYLVDFRLARIFLARTIGLNILSASLIDTLITAFFRPDLDASPYI
jgi:hypothetical protein